MRPKKIAELVRKMTDTIDRLVEELKAARSEIEALKIERNKLRSEEINAELNLTGCMSHNREPEEPKPRWKNASGDRYEVRPLGKEWWGVWRVTTSGHAFQSHEMQASFPSKIQAEAALDEWIGKHRGWKRLPDPDAPETESGDET